MTLVSASSMNINPRIKPMTIILWFLMPGDIYNFCLTGYLEVIFH